MGEKSQGRTSPSQSIIKSIASSEQERKSLEWVEELLSEEASKQESKSDFTSDTWAKIVASELTMADVDSKIQQVEEELFGTKPKPKIRDKKSKVKEVVEEVEEEEEEEDGSEPRHFTFDLGRLDDHVTDLIRLIDKVSYPIAKPMPDTSTTKSLYNISKDTMNKLGLQVVLNRVAIAFEYKNIKASRDFPTPGAKVVNITSEAKSNIWDKLKTMKMNEALRTLAHRTDGIFGKELGIVSGSLLLYPRHGILMVEGPELSLVDYFTQLYKSTLRHRMVKGKVLFIMPHVLIRYFDEWSELEAVSQEVDTEQLALTSNLKEPSKTRQQHKILGNKCANLWKYLRKNKITGIGRTSDDVPEEILPEELLIDMALNSDLLRPLDQWLYELTHLEYTEEPTGELWPETEFTLPETSFKPDQYIESLGITVKAKQKSQHSTAELDKYLTANKKLYEEIEPEVRAEEMKNTDVKKDKAKKQDETVKSSKGKDPLWKMRKKKQPKEQKN